MTNRIPDTAKDFMLSTHMSYFRLFFAVLLLGAAHFVLRAPAASVEANKGYDVTPTGLTPLYPAGYSCSPLTSLYASWIDVDGTRRDEQHSGVDGGRAGDWVLAPAAGVIRAVWRSNWGWGWEGSLLIKHTRQDAGMTGGARLYYSAFDHLNYDEIAKFEVGQRVERGQRLGRVGHPGGNPRYLPEVHWEVWEARIDVLRWFVNAYGGETWTNPTARLIDPLTMFQYAGRPSPIEKGVEIVPPSVCLKNKGCRGFSYILPCKKNTGDLLQ